MILNAAPLLNLIVAPNGCGKSALVCGLIIGLAGDVSLTGRSGNLSEYVRFGCDSGMTDIELKCPGSRNYRIQRKLIVITKPDGNRSSKSEWLLNGKPAKESEVKDFVKSLNIAVDNLCQCLPQERVVEFVKMNSKDLLFNTEKAVGDVSLYQDHIHLIEVSEEVKKLENDKKKLQGRTEEKERENEREGEVIRRAEERNRIKSQIKWLELKKPWLQFEEVRCKYETVRKEIEKLVLKMSKEEKQVEPYKLKAVEYEYKVKDCEKALTAETRKMDPPSLNLKKLLLKLTNCHKKAEELTQEFSAKVANNADRQGQINSLKSQLRNLQNILNASGDEKEKESEIAEENRKMKRLADEMDQLVQTEDGLRSKSKELKTTLSRAESRLQHLDVYHQRRTRLQEHNYNAFRGMEIWSQVKAHFRSPSFPPLLMVIDVKKSEDALYVEASITKRDLFAFVFTDSEDLTNFRKELSAQNVRCAVIMAPEEPTRNQRSIRSLKRYGFTSFVSDLFTAPEAVMDHLCAVHNVDQIPVGPESCSVHSESCARNEGISKFFAGSVRYQMNQSRYDHQIVTTSQPVQPAKFLNIIADKTSLDEVKAEINEAKSRIEAHSEELKTISETLKRKAGDKEKIREQVKLYNHELTEIKRLKREIGLKQANLEDIESNIFDVVQEKAVLAERLQAEAEKAADTAEALVKDQEVLGLLLRKTSSKQSSLTANRARHKIIKDKSEQVSARLKLLEDEKKEKDEIRNTLKSKARQLRTTAENHTVSSGYELVGGQMPQILRDEFERLPDTVAQLEGQLDVLYTQSQNMVGIENESAVEDFENRKKEIAENRKTLQKLSVTLERKQSEMVSLKERWLQPLKQLMDRINENFSHAMRGMGYAGDVRLRGEGVSISLGFGGNN